MMNITYFQANGHVPHTVDTAIKEGRGVEEAEPMVVGGHVHDEVPVGLLAAENNHFQVREVINLTSLSLTWKQGYGSFVVIT